MKNLHSHNYLIVLFGTIALSVMTFFSEGINIRAFIGIGIMLASLIAAGIGKFLIKNDFVKALLINLTPSIATFVYAFVLGGNSVAFLANLVFVSMMIRNTLYITLFLLLILHLYVPYFSHLLLMGLITTE